MNGYRTTGPRRRKIAIEDRKRRQQKNFIACFAKTGFNVSRTCRIIGISRGTYNNWVENEARFEGMLEAAKEEKLDVAESILFDNMQDNNKFVSNAATIFFLKTQAKERGYTEKQDIDLNFTQKRDKSEIDAIVNAASAADNIIIDAKILKPKRKMLGQGGEIEQ